MQRKLLFLSIILLAAMGCSSERDKERLIGKCCFNRNDNRDSIFLNPDFTYNHKYITSDGKLLEINGNWEYSSANSEILLKNFMFFNDQGTNDLPRGNWFSKVELVNDNEIRLMYSAENNICFFKTK